MGKELSIQELKARAYDLGRQSVMIQQELNRINAEINQRETNKK